MDQTLNLGDFEDDPQSGSGGGGGDETTTTTHVKNEDYKYNYISEKLGIKNGTVVRKKGYLTDNQINGAFDDWENLTTHDQVVLLEYSKNVFLSPQGGADRERLRSQIIRQGIYTIDPNSDALVQNKFPSHEGKMLTLKQTTTLTNQLLANGDLSDSDLDELAGTATDDVDNPDTPDTGVTETKEPEETKGNDDPKPPPNQDTRMESSIITNKENKTISQTFEASNDLEAFNNDFDVVRDSKMEEEHLKSMNSKQKLIEEIKALLLVFEYAFKNNSEFNMIKKTNLSSNSVQQLKELYAQLNTLVRGFYNNNLRIGVVIPLSQFNASMKILDRQPVIRNIRVVNQNNVQQQGDESAEGDDLEINTVGDDDNDDDDTIHNAIGDTTDEHTRHQGATVTEDTEHAQTIHDVKRRNRNISNDVQPHTINDRFEIPKSIHRLNIKPNLYNPIDGTEIEANERFQPKFNISQMIRTGKRKRKF